MFIDRYPDRGMRQSKNSVALCESSVVLRVTNYITELHRADTESHRDRMLFFQAFQTPSWQLN